MSEADRAEHDYNCSVEELVNKVWGYVRCYRHSLDSERNEAAIRELVEFTQTKAIKTERAKIRRLEEKIDRLHSLLRSTCDATRARSSRVV